MPLSRSLTPALVCLLLISTQCFGQDARNVTTGFVKDKDGNNLMVIQYDLYSRHKNIPCLVRIKYTNGSRQFYLKALTGDAGNLVMPGQKKQVFWDYVTELVHQTGMGEVRLDVEVLPNITIRNKAKKGNPLIVNLDEVYQKDVHYSVFLYRHERKVALVGDSLNINNSFTVVIPKKTKAGRDYQLAIVHGDKALYSHSFRVKRRIALGWYLLPVAAAGAYIAYGQFVETGEPLPGAPDPPND